LFAAVLRERFPELNATIIKALANRFTYAWK
jgi:hypothetical protein